MLKACGIWFFCFQMHPVIVILQGPFYPKVVTQSVLQHGVLYEVLHPAPVQEGELETCNKRFG